MSKIFAFIEEFTDNENVKLACKIIILIFALCPILGLVILFSSITQNNKKANLVSINYEKWYSQLPDDDILKNSRKEDAIFVKLQGEMAALTGIMLDTSKEIVKYELSELDISEIGIIDYYVNKKINDSKPEYILLDENTGGAITRIKLKVGQTCTVKLLRNGEELGFKYILDEAWNQEEASIKDLISMRFVKTYIDDPEIASVKYNEVIGNKKGNTKIVLMYGMEEVECKIVVK